MFDGSIKSSRKVNLSGRRKPRTGYSARSTSLSSSRNGTDALTSSKEELMLENRLIREERHAMKTRTAASTKIQAQYRRLRDAEAARVAVFKKLEEQLMQVVLTGDIQNMALPTQQLQLFLRQFLFSRPTSRIAKERIRKVQDYMVYMLLVSSLAGTAKAGTNVLALGKDTVWVYQVTKISEIALWTLVREELEMSGENAMITANPYLLLLNTLTDRSKYSVPEAQKAHANVLYHLAVTMEFGTFDAVSACIAQQAKESASRVDNDRLVQVIANIAAQTLRLSAHDEQDRGISITRKFAKTILLSALSASSPITSYVTTMALSTEPFSDDVTTSKRGLFWASVVRHFRDELKVLALSWQQRAISIGNVIELTSTCSFDQALVGVVPFVLSELMTPSLLQWAFDVKHTPQDRMAPDEDYDMDGDREVSVVPPTHAGYTLDEEVQHIAEKLGDAEPSVRAQWQKLRHSNFCTQCLDLLLHAPKQTQSGESAASHFCHVLATVLIVRANTESQC